jgi:hypothetical protein
MAQVSLERSVKEVRNADGTVASVTCVECPCDGFAGTCKCVCIPFHWQTIKLIDSDSQRMLLHYLSKTRLDETIFLLAYLAFLTTIHYVYIFLQSKKAKRWGERRGARERIGCSRIV